MTELIESNPCIFPGQCLQAYQAGWPLCPVHLGSELHFRFFLLHPSILSSHVKMITSNLLLSENAGQSCEKFVKCKCNQTEHLCAWPEDATRFQYVLKAGFWSDLWTCAPKCSHKCSLQPQLAPLCCSHVLLWQPGQLYCPLPVAVPNFSQFLIRQEASRTRELHSRLFTSSEIS